MKSTLRRTLQKHFFCILISVGIPSFSQAMLAVAHAGQEPARGALTLDYPELQVTPLSSERLLKEVAHEKESQWTRLAPLQLAALATLTSGVGTLASSNNDLSFMTMMTGFSAVGIGGAGLLITSLASWKYQPMSDGAAELQGLGAQTPRDRLIRERMAEEHLRQAARMGRILRWTVGATSLLASAGTTYIGARKMDTPNITIGVVSSVASLLPFLFPTRWERIAAEQENYKKKIYGPLGAHWQLNPVVLSDTGGAQAGAAFSWQYHF
jgi:hypothetical protein